MAVCFPGTIFNKKNHLVILDGGELFWSSEIPEYAWCAFGNSQKPQISQVCKLFKIELGSLLKPEQLKAFESLDADLDNIPFSLVQPPHEFKERLQKGLDKSLEALRVLSSSGYERTFYTEQEVLLRMTAAQYDYSAAINYFKKNKKTTNKSVLKSFETLNGFLDPAVYSNTSTSTGRMTIKSGPQILTAPKKMRNFIRPSSSKNLIAQADFVSLEPRVGRFLAGGNPDKDVYESIGKSVFDNKLNRDQVKKAFLPAIYGAGHRTLSSMLPDGIKAKDVIHSLREYLNFNEIVSSKREELRKEGVMKNYFGRPVIPSSDRDTVIYNNWLQSSAVSISLLGFKKLLDNFSFLSPLFLIHDAIIFEFPKEKEKEVKDFLESGVDIENIGNFPMSYLAMSR